MLVLTLGISVLGLVFAFLLARFVLQEGTGTDAMRAISDAIKEGAEAFLRRQYKTIGILAIVVAVLIYILYAVAKGDPDQAWRTTVAFLFGAFCSALAGYIGMYISIRANIRTASAVRTSMNQALKISFRGGAVSGVTIVTMSLLGIVLLFLLYGGQTEPQKVPFLIVGYGFGASFVALFAQLGGGIYTKAADVGADLVGKVEAGIPEDDPRNPAVIADLVGDNVGDCAGRGADLFESTAAENIGAMILGVALYMATKNVGWILFPLVVRAFGLIASAIGLLWIRPSVVTEPDKAAGKDPGEIAMNQLNIGYFITCGLSIIGIFLGSFLLLNGHSVTSTNGIPPWVWFGLAGTVGILLSVPFVYITQYYTPRPWA